MNEQPLSKNQIKKQKKLEKLKELKPLKRQQEKQRRKQNKQKAYERGDKEYLSNLRKNKKPRRSEITHSNVKIVLDSNFDQHQTDKEIISLGNQITTCYSLNRQSTTPTHLQVTSYRDKLKNRLDSLSRENWNGNYIEFRNENFENIYESSQCVYLTADTNDMLDDLNTDDVYIIGAMVDHNRLKNITANKAKELGIRTAALPIGNYIQMSSRKVLTVNHVYNILLKYLEYKDWEKAFYSVIPRRKLDEGNNSENNSTNSNDDIDNEQSQDQEQNQGEQ